MNAVKIALVLIIAVMLCSGGIAAAAQGCEYNGQQYKPGDSFKDADGCNNCQCTETGVVACNLMAC